MNWKSDVTCQCFWEVFWSLIQTTQAQLFTRIYHSHHRCLLLESVMRCSQFKSKKCLSWTKSRSIRRWNRFSNCRKLQIKWKNSALKWSNWRLIGSWLINSSSKMTNLTLLCTTVQKLLNWIIEEETSILDWSLKHCPLLA